MKRIVLGATVLGLAVAGLAPAQAAPSVFKVTGGGQITAGLTSGAGSTIAFTAQSDGGPESPTGDNAKGQFQLQLRQIDGGGKGTGKNQETIHGTVTCVTVFSAGQGGMAVLGGISKAGEAFRIDVTDDGQGQDALDLVSVRRGEAAYDGGDDDEDDTSLCDAEDEQADMALGRGNVKIHKVRG